MNAIKIDVSQKTNEHKLSVNNLDQAKPSGNADTIWMFSPKKADKNMAQSSSWMNISR